MVSAWFFGDPHIHTLDNFEYTFNGLGEYTLIGTTGGNFTLQGRTAKAIDKDGQETKATVFSAFAAKDSDSDRVYIAMNATRNGNVVLLKRNVTRSLKSLFVLESLLNSFSLSRFMFVDVHICSKRKVSVILLLKLSKEMTVIVRLGVTCESALQQLL